MQSGPRQLADELFGKGQFVASALDVQINRLPLRVRFPLLAKSDRQRRFPDSPWRHQKNIRLIVKISKQLGKDFWTVEEIVLLCGLPMMFLMMGS
jgi:hypothetical protein